MLSHQSTLHDPTHRLAIGEAHNAKRDKPLRPHTESIRVNRDFRLADPDRQIPHHTPASHPNG